MTSKLNREPADPDREYLGSSCPFVVAQCATAETSRTIHQVIVTFANRTMNFGVNHPERCWDRYGH